MVNKTLTRKKLNNDKGVTGVDIVVSVTMIVVTIAVVMAIFVNISSTSREVNRTSGATRMATNILENIELMYYQDFLTELEALRHKTTYVTYENEVGSLFDYNGTYIISGEKMGSDKVFNTKIPNGYTLKLTISSVFGENNTSKYDLVRNVSVSVVFDTAGREKDVTLNTTKTFERLYSVYNQPVNEEKYFYKLSIDADKQSKYRDLGIQYVEKVFEDSTIKFKVSDVMPTSYNYGIDETGFFSPAMAIIKSDENINEGYVEPSKKDQIYVWIPSHFVDVTFNPDKIVYEYETYKIARTSVLKDDKATGAETNFFTVSKNISVNGYDFGFKSADDEALKGIWISIEQLNSINEESTLTEKNLKLYWTTYLESTLNEI